jgi:3-deoxy-manno-octulosonate cytidylyltransferase (CMP-KDO synthetase)
VTARAAAVLPVRHASVRLPGKPLLDRTGKPLIRHVWEAVCRARTLDPVIVATDDERIAQAARGFGARVELTSPAHPSGSDRVAEVARRLDAELVVNVQGDEPDVEPADLDRLVERLAAGGEELVTLAYHLGADEAEAFADPHQVKVVVDDRGRALYFSRCPIPHGAPPERALGHLGVYGWRRDALLRFADAPPAEAERHERLEQLRALAMGMTVGVVVTPHRSLGIDTPEDYARFVARQQGGARAPGGTA